MLMSVGNFESQAGCEMIVPQVLSVIRGIFFLLFIILFHCSHFIIMRRRVEKIEKKTLILAILRCHQELSI